MLKKLFIPIKRANDTINNLYLPASKFARENIVVVEK